MTNRRHAELIPDQAPDPPQRRPRVARVIAASAAVGLALGGLGTAVAWELPAQGQAPAGADFALALTDGQGAGWVPAERSAKSARHRSVKSAKSSAGSGRGSARTVAPPRRAAVNVAGAAAAVAPAAADRAATSPTRPPMVPAARVSVAAPTPDRGTTLQLEQRLRATTLSPGQAAALAHALGPGPTPEQLRGMPPGELASLAGARGLRAADLERLLVDNEVVPAEPSPIIPAPLLAPRPAGLIDRLVGWLTSFWRP